MTRSKPTTGDRQLPLAPPAAPKIDLYGLHAVECECTRCSLGHRPSLDARNRARWAWEKRERAKRAAEIAAAAGVEPSRAEVNQAEAAERTRRRLEREAAETAARVRADEEFRARARMPSPEEMDEWKRECGLKPGRKGTP